MVPEFSRSYLQQLIEQGDALIDGRVVTKVSTKVRLGHQVVVTLRATPQSQAFVPEDMPIDVVYEDAHLRVINKPAGLVVHPAPGNWRGTLLNGLLALDPLASEVPRAGIVHRLDMDTSGVMVVCKSEFALASLGRQFQDRTISRRYRAFGVGQPKAPWAKTGRVDARLARDPRDRKRMAVVAETASTGKNAATNYEIVKRFGIGLQGNPGAAATEMVCVLETGRTHQIRVHMAHVGMPLIGDQVYGDTKAARALNTALPEEVRLKRQALHAETLAFTHPATSERMSFQSDLPEDLLALRTALSDL
jgi:23S rRNA pseudouridine1911/1915/1917 synthase